MIEKIDNFNSARLIPEMNFTCRGTTMKVIVAGKPQNGRPPNNMTRRPIKLQIWRLENSTIVEHGRYRRVNNIDLTPNICRGNMNEIRTFGGINVYSCTLKSSAQISVEPGDILGIELPPKPRANLELYSVTESGLTNYIFERASACQSCIIDLFNRSRTIETTVHVLPLVRVEVKPSRIGE